MTNKKCSHVKKGMCRGCLRRESYENKMLDVDLARQVIEIGKTMKTIEMNNLNYSDKEWIAFAEKEIEEWQEFIKFLKK